MGNKMSAIKNPMEHREQLHKIPQNLKCFMQPDPESLHCPLAFAEIQCSSTEVANHSTGYGSSCLLAEPAIL